MHLVSSPCSQIHFELGTISIIDNLEVFIRETQIKNKMHAVFGFSVNIFNDKGNKQDFFFFNKKEVQKYQREMHTCNFLSLTCTPKGSRLIYKADEIQEKGDLPSILLKLMVDLFLKRSQCVFDLNMLFLAKIKHICLFI